MVGMDDGRSDLDWVLSYVFLIVIGGGGGIVGGIVFAPSPARAVPWIATELVGWSCCWGGATTSGVVAGKRHGVWSK